MFAELGRAGGIFDLEVYTAIVIVVAYTTLLSPFWIKLFYRFYGHALGEDDREEEDGAAIGATGPPLSVREQGSERGSG